MELSPNSAYTSADAHDLRQTHHIRLAALVCSGVSVTACMVAFYWFGRMDKLFRHRLIMLLIYGDLTVTTWYFVFAVYSIARGTVKTQSRFCQSSGFMIQYGAETSDYAVLVMAIHSALQVFRPASHGTSDGLYKYRYFVYLGGFTLPVVMASLAFVNPDSAYLSQGAFCTLPIRPFWYRLALAWIPRYLIALTIIGLAIAIYAYVGFEFRSYASISQSIKTPTTTTIGMTLGDMETAAPSDIATKTPEMTELAHDVGRRASSIAHDDVSGQRRGSAISFESPIHSTRTANASHSVYSHTLPGSSAHLPLQRNLSARPPLVGIPSGYTVRPPSCGTESEGPVSPTARPIDDPLSNFLTQGPAPSHDQPSSSNASPTSATQRHLHRQRMRIHRQLRLMFIYPLVYTLMWLIPFVQHCMMYSDYFAGHPIFSIRMGTVICTMSIGFVDCLIFTMREKPWRSIQTSDGSIWGSFFVWRGRQLGSLSNRELVGGSVDSGTLERIMTGSVDGVGMRRGVRTSASDDHTKLAVEQARVRLDLEREERLERLKERMAARQAADLEAGSSDYGSDEEGFVERDGEAVGAKEPKGKEKLVGPVIV